MKTLGDRYRYKKHSISKDIMSGRQKLNIEECIITGRRMEVHCRYKVVTAPPC